MTWQKFTKFYFSLTKWQLNILITFDNKGKRSNKYPIIVRCRINRLTSPSLTKNKNILNIYPIENKFVIDYTSMCEFINVNILRAVRQLQQFLKSRTVRLQTRGWLSLTFSFVFCIVLSGFNLFPDSKIFMWQIAEDLLE